MTAFTTLGKGTKTTFLENEPEKISIEFEVATGQTVYPGMPVKLTTAGKITPWAAADGKAKIVGYCYQGGTQTQLVTVFTVGFILIYALSNADTQDAGLAVYKGYDSATTLINDNYGYNKYGAASVDLSDEHAYALDAAATALTLIRVLLK